MKKALIKIGHTIVISKDSKDENEQKIRSDSFNEFAHQLGRLNQYKNWADIISSNDIKFMKTINTESAKAVSMIVSVSKRDFKPILENPFDNINLEFTSWSHIILEGNRDDIESYKIAITKITKKIILVDSFNDSLLLSNDDPLTLKSTITPINTFHLKMIPELSIVEYTTL
jgi:hypothetical protein